MLKKDEYVRFKNYDKKKVSIFDLYRFWNFISARG